ncbi:hypothetical protein MSG28_001886 [Choristoneura fumiferana]|uniref:Uncharacterized protein n=1 Tax=Choristoneura fumiferana TaxID=7141 RepID=A0ACC0JTC2_CHOFU|nr:hypothetical protein MSG28_001886 [Choristoneura fumiferana]
MRMRALLRLRVRFRPKGEEGEKEGKSWASGSPTHPISHQFPENLRNDQFHRDDSTTVGLIGPFQVSMSTSTLLRSLIYALSPAKPIGRQFVAKRGRVLGQNAKKYNDDPATTRAVCTHASFSLTRASGSAPRCCAFVRGSARVVFGNRAQFPRELCIFPL